MENREAFYRFCSERDLFSEEPESLELWKKHQEKQPQLEAKRAYNAEAQRKHRAKAMKTGKHLNYLVDVEIIQALERLAAHRSKTKKAMLLELITKADEAEKKTLYNDEEAYERYIYAVKNKKISEGEIL